MAGSINTLDAPDLAVRRIMQKRADGYRLSNRELSRLGARQSAEDEVTRTGGVVQRPITPRQISAFEQGQKAKADDEDFAAGYENRAPGATAAAGISGASAPADSAPDQSETPRAVRPAPPSAGDYPANMSGADMVTAMRARGNIDVRSYTGSMWSQPGSYTAPRPSGPAAPSAANASADKILRRRFGAPPNERPGAAATTSNENTADSLLRRRFGPPPSERDTLDVATNPRRPVTARRLY